MAAFQWGVSGGAHNTGLRALDITGTGRRLSESTSSVGSWHACRPSTDLTKTTGKWLFEITYFYYTASTAEMGLVHNGTLTTNPRDAGQNSPLYYLSTGAIWRNNAQVVAGAGAETGLGNVLSFLYDAGTRKIWVAKNGTVLFGGGDPVAGTTPAYTDPGAGGLQPFVAIYERIAGEMIVGAHTNQIQYPFTGYVPWGDVPASISFPADAIKLADKVTSAADTDVEWALWNASRELVASGTGLTIAGGAATINFTGDVVNGELLRVDLSNWDGVTPGNQFPQMMTAKAAVV